MIYWGERAADVKFIVWGSGMVPAWLRDYGARPATRHEQQLPAVQPFGADWVVAVSCYESDIIRYGQVDTAVAGWTRLDPTKGDD